MSHFAAVRAILHSSLQHLVDLHQKLPVVALLLLGLSRRTLLVYASLVVPDGRLRNKGVLNFELVFTLGRVQILLIVLQDLVDVVLNFEFARSVTLAGPVLDFDAQRLWCSEFGRAVFRYLNAHLELVLHLTDEVHSLFQPLTQRRKLLSILV